MSERNLQDLFGSIDIYVFDQLLKGRFVPGMRVLDAGCGSGRNLVYFLRNGYDVFGVDQSAEAISQTRELAYALAPQLPAENFRVEAVEKMSWASATPRRETGRSRTADYGNSPEVKEDPPAHAGGSDKIGSEASGFDVVLSSAVLHFARDHEQWQAMVDEMWRVLKSGGIFFARLASSIGMEQQVRLIVGRRYRLPDGSDRFLVDEEMLRRVTAALGGEFIEPIKTTVVENMRAMTTWVIRKK
jgi:SAM-dependent methyltransferase